MGDIIYVNFRDKAKLDKRKGATSAHNQRVLNDLAAHDKETKEGEELKRRFDNVQGSLKRINRLIEELKNPSKENLTSEELDKILDDVYTRR